MSDEPKDHAERVARLIMAQLFGDIMQDRGAPMSYEKASTDAVAAILRGEYAGMIGKWIDAGYKGALRDVDRELEAIASCVDGERREQVAACRAVISALAPK